MADSCQLKTIAHISDLHFGTEQPAILEALRDELLQCQPDILIVSGDLTQRARVGQFRAARRYLSRLPSPQLVIPGNHDVPLYNLFRRFLSPLGRYRRYIDAEVNPVFQDDGLLVLGINTARSLTWKSGRISHEQILAIDRRLAQADGDRFRVIVTHHPFIPPPGEEHAGVTLVGRAKAALKMLDQYKVDMLLAGHLHHGYTGDVRSYYPSSERSIIVAQAGTAVSRRLREESNAYNLIRCRPGDIRIHVRTYDGTSFKDSVVHAYTATGKVWHRVENEASSTPRRSA